MTAVAMDGKALAAEVGARLKSEAERMAASGIRPTLATILVGDDPASKVYVASKHRAAERVGIASRSHTLPADTAEDELLALIRSLNGDRDVNGILLQMPLPHHLSGHRAVDAIDPEKDVDGLTATNAGRLAYGSTDMVPCTPRGIMELLHRYAVPVRSSRAVIINRSPLVGKPLYHLLLAEDATVTTCHSRSADLKGIAREADILVTAVGKRPQFAVGADMVKEGATVIDVAMNRVGGKLTGDVEYDEVARKAAFITPVPGGVGPMTVIMLMKNTLLAAGSQNRFVLPEAPQQ